MTIISRSITVSTPYIGWLLLPNTPLVKKTRCLLLVGFGRLWRPTEDTFVVTLRNLSRVVGNCNQGFAACGEITP